MPVPKLVATAVMMAAQIALTAMQTTEGPRLQDTRATVADYGTPCNNVLGTRIVPAHCIFAKPIEEKRTRRKGKGGKGYSYTGYATFQVQVAEHAIGGVLQIYLDNHLVYDATTTGGKIYPLGEDYDFETNVRFHLGAEDQEPDPDMLAYIEARDGPGTCPAYRGQGGIYFERLPVQNFGNRFPDVKVMVGPVPSIEYVGGMTYIAGNGGNATAVPFALTGGLASTPAADDTVIILSATAGNGDFNPAVTGYTQLVTHINQGGIGRISACLWGKRMGATPDTTWSALGSGVGTNAQAWIVMVFRRVHVDILEGPVVRRAYTAPGVDPLPYTSTITGDTFDPAPLCTMSGNFNNAAFTFALKDFTGRSILMVAAGARQALTNFWTAGNMELLRYVNSNDSWKCSAGMAFGGTYTVTEGTSLGEVLTRVARRADLEADEFDFSQVFGAPHSFPGYNWTQGTGQQICEHLADLFDVDLRPHDFIIQALPRGSVSEGSIPTGQFARGSEGEAHFVIPDVDDKDLPRRVFLTYADVSAGHETNVAMPVGGPDRGATGSAGELSIDMATLALDPTRAQQLIERRQRRVRMARNKPEFALSRRMATIEPGDVWTPDFDGEPLTCRLTKLTIGADGVVATEWEQDDPRLAILPSSEGAPAAGWIPPRVPTSVDSFAAVLDTALLVDAHDQTAPLVYVAGSPAEPGVWMGLDLLMSDTGESETYEPWEGIASADGAVFGTCADALPTAQPWVPDMGSVLVVTVSHGELTAASLDDLQFDPARNLAAIRSGDGWELVQFMTPTLVATRQYELRGLLRGLRGTEHAIGSHSDGDRFVLLDGTVKRRTMGAGEIGDTDYYLPVTTGQALDESDAFALEYTGGTHRPYAPVHPAAEQDGADWLFHATRRTRVGGATLDGQDVPLGEASESWALDIYDGPAVVRTITGTSLPLTYLEADQIADFGGALSESPEATLQQVSPSLSLRGYPLHFPEGMS